jgi:hypothetical protein
LISESVTSLKKHKVCVMNSCLRTVTGKRGFVIWGKMSTNSQRILIAFSGRKRTGFFYTNFWLWGLNSGLWTCYTGVLPHELHLQPLFALVVLEIRSCFLRRLTGTLSYLSQSLMQLGMTVHTTSLSCWLRWGLVNILPWATSYHEPPDHSFLSN